MSALILTLGDPNGLGPQLAVRIPEERLCPKGDRLLMIGSEKPLLRHCQDAGRPPFWRRIGVDTVCAGIPPGIWLLEPEAQFEPAFGRATTNGGLVAGQSLELACTILSRKRDWALVTCPINKSTLNRAGFCFSGHTEFLAEYTKSGQKNVCMHLCGSRLRVSLVTTHPALKDVPGLINRERILKCLSLTRDFLIRLGAEQTRIAVCGLNPHAGEDGKIGDEEGRIIRPAVE
ncbi:MAG: PdxA family protein, partial [Desulfonatronovibrionaceae bacterium]